MINDLLVTMVASLRDLKRYRIEGSNPLLRRPTYNVFHACPGRIRIGIATLIDWIPTTHSIRNYSETIISHVGFIQLGIA